MINILVIKNTSVFLLAVKICLISTKPAIWVIFTHQGIMNTDFGIIFVIKYFFI